MTTLNNVVDDTCMFLQVPHTGNSILFCFSFRSTATESSVKFVHSSGCIKISLMHHILTMYKMTSTFLKSLSNLSRLECKTAHQPVTKKDVLVYFWRCTLKRGWTVTKEMISTSIRKNLAGLMGGDRVKSGDLVTLAGSMLPKWCRCRSANSGNGNEMGVKKVLSLDKERDTIVLP